MLKTIKSFIGGKFPVSSRKIYHSLNKLIFKGDNYYCPICEKGFKRFLPAGGNITGNSKCPGCNSLERQRLLWLYLTRQLKIKEDEIKLLNIAPDYAIQSKLKKLTNISYLSVDLESPLAMQKMDITSLSFDNNTFDAVLCYHVLEHIEDDKKALSEIFRVLKPDAWAILQSPVDMGREITFEDFSVRLPEERKKIFGQEDHVRIYGKDYVSRIEKEGFLVSRDNFIEILSAEEREKFVLERDEIIYFCKKPL